MAVIFDFDGIIVDTEPIHYQAFQEVLVPAGMGFTWEEYIETYIGFDDRDVFRQAYQAGGKELKPDTLAQLIDTKAEIFARIVKRGVTTYPGVVSLVNNLKGKVPLALCSGALKRDILPILDQIGIQDAFPVMVTAEDVAESKPSPQSYQLTVKRLIEFFPESGLTPECCVAIEDTPAGIESASGAGVKVIAVTNSYGAEKLSGAQLVLDSLEDVTPEMIRNP